MSQKIDAIGRFKVKSLLSEGRLSQIYRAWDQEKDGWVAIKLFSTDHLGSDGEKATFVRNLLQMERINTTLIHPNIVRLFEFGEDQGRPFFVMEFIAGKTLLHILKGGERPDFPFMALMVTQVASALDYAHKKGYAHRNLKPSKIIVGWDGTTKLTDFGTIGDPDPNRTRSQNFFLNPEYAYPEQIEDQPVDHRADIFVLGTICHELVTGRNPFTGSNVRETLRRICQNDPQIGTPRPYLGIDEKSFREVIAQAIQTKPDKRYEKVMDFARLFRNIHPDFINFETEKEEITDKPPTIEETPVTAEVTPLEEHAEPALATPISQERPEHEPEEERKRGPWLWLAPILLILVAGLIWWIGRPDTPEPINPVSQSTPADTELSSISGPGSAHSESTEEPTGIDPIAELETTTPPDEMIDDQPSFETTAGPDTTTSTEEIQEPEPAKPLETTPPNDEESATPVVSLQPSSEEAETPKKNDPVRTADPEPVVPERQTQAENPEPVLDRTIPKQTEPDPLPQQLETLAPSSEIPPADNQNREDDPQSETGEPASEVDGQPTVSPPTEEPMEDLQNATASAPSEMEPETPEVEPEVIKEETSGSTPDLTNIPDVVLSGEPGVEDPVFTRQIAPNYPKRASRTYLEGSVLLLATFKTDGKVADIIVVRGIANGRFGFEQEAIKAVKRWKFKPGRFNGNNHHVRMYVQLDFKAP